VKKERMEALIGNASLLMVLAGGGYLVDCRVDGGSPDKCWLTALPIMGVGAAGRGAFQLGYVTPNPSITPRQRRQAAQTESVE
jgi:hypothetical protein